MGAAERKITKIGNSLGVTFPIQFLSALGLNQGDEIQMEVEEDKIIIKKQKKVDLPEGISADFFETLNETIAQYDVTIKGLKDR